jgi:hypothetical protein
MCGKEKIRIHDSNEDGTINEPICVDSGKTDPFGGIAKAIGDPNLPKFLVAVDMQLELTESKRKNLFLQLKSLQYVRLEPTFFQSFRN